MHNVLAEVRSSTVTQQCIISKLSTLIVRQRTVLVRLGLVLVK